MAPLIIAEAGEEIGGFHRSIAVSDAVHLVKVPDLAGALQEPLAICSSLQS